MVKLRQKTVPEEFKGIVFMVVSLFSGVSYKGGPTVYCERLFLGLIVPTLQCV